MGLLNRYEKIRMDKDARSLLRRLIINEIREIFEPFSIRESSL